MLKKQIQNDRIEKNLKVLKLLSNNDPSINEEQKREVINGYTGWGGLREAIFTPCVYRQLKRYLTNEGFFAGRYGFSRHRCLTL